MKNDCKMIEIPFEEYKELLEYKGRYLELKDSYYKPWTTPTTPTTPNWPTTPTWPLVTYTGDKIKEATYPYKVTLDNTK